MIRPRSCCRGDHTRARESRYPLAKRHRIPVGFLQGHRIPSSEQSLNQRRFRLSPRVVGRHQPPKVPRCQAPLGTLRGLLEGANEVLSCAVAKEDAPCHACGGVCS
eukprot:10857484-Alexandrium_andersonii.AAC.1